MRGQGNGSQISHRPSSVTPTALPKIACLRWERAMVWWRLRRGRGDGRGGGRGAAAAVPTPTAFVLFFLGPPASFDETCSQCTAIVFAKHDYRVCNARLSCSQCTAIVFAMLCYRVRNARLSCSQCSAIVAWQRHVHVRLHVVPGRVWTQPFLRPTAALAHHNCVPVRMSPWWGTGGQEGRGEGSKRERE